MNYLLVPGLGGSGPDHWQARWAASLENMTLLQQDDWDTPFLEDWLRTLAGAIEQQMGPTILVAHSLAVSLVLHWAARHQHHRVVGAMLVAPADVDSSGHTPDVARNFAPMPLITLPFSSILIASENDAFVSLERASFFADQWGSDLINIGRKGHINADSKLGSWEDGQKFLKQLTISI